MLRLFHIHGIAVRLDPGWLVIFGLVAWSLATAYFPRILPGLSPPAYWAHGVAAALLADHFSVSAMTDRYEAVYRTRVG